LDGAQVCSGSLWHCIGGMNKRILSSFAENSSSFVLLFSFFPAALLWAYLCHHDVLIIADVSNSNSGSVYAHM